MYESPAADELKQTEDRYARHNLMDWWDQSRVAAAGILVAGAGAIGNEVIKLLALMGAHNLTIVDSDRVELANLTRSVLFRDSDIGKSKALVAADRAREINPSSRALGIEGDLEFDIGLGVYRGADVVIGCLDSINARLAVNRACLRVGTPWLNGGIEDVFGEVTLHAGSAACFECGMTSSMWTRRNRRFSCSGQQVDVEPDHVPTTATMASLIAVYLVNEALMLIHSDSIDFKLGLRPGQKLVVSMKPYDFRIADLCLNPDCTAHEFWSPICILEATPDSITPIELLQITACPNGILEIGFDLLTGMSCIQCGHTEEMLQPVEKSRANLTHCPGCGGDTRRPNSVSWIGADSTLAQLPLSALSIPEHPIVSIKGDNGRNYYQLGGESETRFGARPNGCFGSAEGPQA